PARADVNNTEEDSKKSREKYFSRLIDAPGVSSHHFMLRRHFPLSRRTVFTCWFDLKPKLISITAALKGFHDGPGTVGDKHSTSERCYVFASCANGLHGVASSGRALSRRRFPVSR